MSSRALKDKVVSKSPPIRFASLSLLLHVAAAPLIFYKIRVLTHVFASKVVSRNNYSDLE